MFVTIHLVIRAHRFENHINRRSYLKRIGIHTQGLVLPNTEEQNTAYNECDDQYLKYGDAVLVFNVLSPLASSFLVHSGGSNIRRGESRFSPFYTVTDMTLSFPGGNNLLLTHRHTC